MTDGQSEWMRESEVRSIPNERDQIDAPPAPDLRCREHSSLCEVVHSLHDRVVAVEQRLRILEDREQDPAGCPKKHSRAQPTPR